ncbi:mediator of RNA polymerase II transcription subunit 4 [Neocloeon triangulifer]|uniref:mediator of RNA polymerase II transcription subunit 4 n=1 Tax=Neocloeon triangulifer TaxID=2078957 RepID=UPI00286EE88F|nr:mediator of RNA polymerase II transcription subunit 4 [Neocloeon triangulifer]
MASSNVGTREKLLSLIDDVELISKEMLENVLVAKPQKMSSSDYDVLTDLLVSKDKEIKETLKVAATQAEVESKIAALRVQVEKQDQDIQTLQKQLKEAEHILATAIFQAKQKLQSIGKANKKPVQSEELIKFAHRISSTNAISAPSTWQPGDPRRPYPTDIEMRMGFLGRLGDVPVGASHIIMGSPAHMGAGLPDGSAFRPGQPEPIMASHPHQFSWQSGELHMLLGGPGGGGATVPMDTGGRGNFQGKDTSQDTVEVMSTDSSSSSSSDSQ